MAPHSFLPPYVLGIMAGIASGAAMLPNTVIKEANLPQYAGTATGVVNFINFTFSALLGPGLRKRSCRRLPVGVPEPWNTTRSRSNRCLYGVAAAILLTLLLKETGPGGRARIPKQYWSNDRVNKQGQENTSSYWNDARVWIRCRLP